MKFKPLSIFRKKEKQLDRKDKSKIEHQDFLKQELAESRREERKAKSIKQKMLRRINKDKEILAKENILGRTRGKPTHGARGNKNE